MKRGISIVMILALAVQLQWGSGYLIDYFVNTEAYKELCKNKDFPELNCNGKCILAEKLQQESNTQSAINNLPISIEYTFLEFLTSFHNKCFFLEKKDAIFLMNYSFLAFLKVFKPPS